MSLANLIKVGKRIEFGTLYIKPAFVFIDDSGHIKLQFEADPSSAMAYLYDNLCKELGIAWNYDTPYNKEGVYTNCAMHASGDRAKYGCGPDGTGVGVSIHVCSSCQKQHICNIHQFVPPIFVHLNYIGILSSNDGGVLSQVPR